MLNRLQAVFASSRARDCECLVLSGIRGGVQQDAGSADPGKQTPILLDAEGRGLDGRNRLWACRAAGVAPPEPSGRWQRHVSRSWWQGRRAFGGAPALTSRQIYLEVNSGGPARRRRQRGTSRTVWSITPAGFSRAAMRQAIARRFDGGPDGDMSTCRLPRRDWTSSRRGDDG
jgi:hypothetical protein